MPSDSTIGTGGDYTTIQAWLDDLPSTLVGVNKGRCFNEVFDEVLTIDGFTSTPTDYLWLTADDGASLLDNDANPLRPDEAAGATIKTTVGYVYILRVNTPYTKLNRMQLIAVGTSTDGIFANTTFECSRCIVYATGHVVQNGQYFNNLIIMENTENNRIILNFAYSTPSSGEYNTFAVYHDFQPFRITIGFYFIYATPLFRNNAIFGNDTSYSYMGGGIHADNDTNSTENNETISSSDLPNIPYSAITPFVNANKVGADFKLADGSPLIGAATPVAGIAEDIFGNPRDPVNPCIGCYEVLGAPPVVSGTDVLMFGTDF